MEFQETEHRPDKVTVKMGNHNIDFTDSDEASLLHMIEYFCDKKMVFLFNIQDTFAVKKILMHSEYNSTIIINDIGEDISSSSSSSS